MNSLQNISAEIIVVGAGLAGVTAAAVLARQGRRVILVDPRPSCLPLFRGEKLEPNQAEMLDKLGLLDHLLPQTRRIREVWGGYNGRCFKIFPLKQYSMYYSDMVNVLRAHSPIGVEHKLGHVEHIANGNELQCVRLRSGEELTSRLVVLANGVCNHLQDSLGLHKDVIQKDQSIAFGFSIARRDLRPFPFDATTYYPTTYTEYIDYLALFVMRQEMRANLFVFRTASDPWVRQFVKQPDQMLERALPKLSQLIGEYRVVTKVETGRVDLYRMRGELQPGIVLIGDAYQVACPSTGMGFTKIFMDVDVLSQCVPEWFATPGIGVGKIASFYNNSRKQATDARALETASFERHVVMDRSILWQFHRLKMHLPRMFGSGHFHHLKLHLPSRKEVVRMRRGIISRMLRPFQLTARRFLILPEDKGYTGEHSCLHNAAAFVAWNQIEGDYLEFGVYQGDSFAAAYRAIHKERARRSSFLDNSPSHARGLQTRLRCFAFDSFSGLPEGPGPRHADYTPGAYACTQSKFTRNIVKLGVDLKDVVVVPGFYDKTLNRHTKEQHELRRAAIVMIDCDLFESTVPVLEFVTDLVDQGTILIFHDWFRFSGSPKCGEQRACREWLDRNPHLELVEFWREGPQSLSFLVNLR